jgi:ubiquinone/menaquinone biosynthesis C-methylase UbiE
LTGSHIIERFQKRLCRISDEFGLYEAILFTKSIDRWRRYAIVQAKIREMKNDRLRILDVGSGGIGVSILQNSLKKDCVFYLLDVTGDAFRDITSPYRIVGDACQLPFRGKVFDVVVSTEVVEHISKPVRVGFWKEIERVCKGRIVVTCPMQSGDGFFQGARYDMLYQRLFEKRYGSREPNTERHIAVGHPTLEEVRGLFPDLKIEGFNNCTIWLKYMSLSCRPIAGIVSGLLYYLLWKKLDDSPPFWSAVITLDSVGAGTSRDLPRHHLHAWSSVSSRLCLLCHFHDSGSSGP